MRLLLDDGTELKAEQIAGPCVLLIQPLEKWTDAELQPMIQAMQVIDKHVLNKHGIDSIVANADVKVTVIWDPVYWPASDED